MIRRLSVLALLLVAAASVSTPVHAAPHADMNCANNGYSTIACGLYYTEDYTFSPWTVSRPGYSYTVPYGGNEVLIFSCTVGTYYSVSITLTDSTGSSTITGGARCRAVAD